MMRIRDIFRSTLSDLMTAFFSKQCTHIGAEQMQLDTNSSPTPTTNTPEKKENAPSFHLRHIYDEVTFPSLQLRACLSGPEEDRWGYSQWLGRASCRIVDNPLESDFVIFTGGADVSPMMYGEAPIAETIADPARDTEDLKLYELCRANGIPMVGICRGAQFLWTRMGGKLFQHVDRHNSGEHDIFVFGENKKYRASSVHHQQCKPEALPGMKLLANCSVATTRKSANYVHSGPSSDFEIFAFPDEAILGIQGHPEYPGFPNYSELCARLIDDYIYDNKATIYKGGQLRISAIVNKETK